MNACAHRHQRGTTLVIALLMLILITMMTLTGLTLSSSNLTAVGNMQFREQAIAAANKAIQQVIGSAFVDDPTAETIAVDLDDDGVTDFTVTVAQPQCVRAWQAGSAAPSSLSLPSALSASTSWHSIWEIDASVSDTDNTATAVQIRSGVRRLLSQAQKLAVCP
ncbi:pilus assembly PilX family protein [Plasticicumulans acidivorans]|uniref:Type 4 fimbrial biogenesis protein PilX N-terminal domain-containing protein n=1 Tax=Plasticicumulans acidivorans TaxID=886464 RepID=A0A317MTU0_9GAMM|nr:hypothetical protein [Plasticicumulans acidivorans]PWV61035.1 hypothetical protein C7443_10649 [Plasticicumulans acidivorans]